MALSHPLGFDIDQLRATVRTLYRSLALDPASNVHFHCGPEYAVERLGYDPEELALLPAEATASFAGVGNPFRMGAIGPAETVLDVGCGTGTDLLIAARRVGPGGRAIGVDMTAEMRNRARSNARQMGMRGRVDVRPGLAEDLPVSDASIDVVISNGVINLTTDKVRALAEIRRVLKPGGRLHLADIALDVDLSEKERLDPALWAG
jgi:arsenite methyltransferase